ncbi:hypothetical protein [Arcobacter sp. CECT 8985]|uniref:hypothetical protein n=1 Tax=Arcobacter sp. CECT 8985 TaxID=1935424 RepID=UPI00100ABE36|nr:hypothetical protein [Arcobacter sp. CECT 8985]RXJ88192.1 hypothetical protein CRU93_00940 [Arcobacter sp. CECT 8985]
MSILKIFKNFFKNKFINKEKIIPYEKEEKKYYETSQIKTIQDFYDEFDTLNDFSSEKIDYLYKKYINVLKKYEIKFIKEFEGKLLSSIVCEFPFLKNNNVFINTIGNEKLELFIPSKKFKLDYSILLDSNVTSDLEKYFKEQKIHKKDFVDNSNLIINEKCNFDLLPYCLENIINFCIHKGSNIQLNRKDSIQEGMFQNLDILYENFKSLNLPKLEDFILQTNKQIPFIFKIFNNSRLFLIFVLQSRLLFPKKDKRQTSHIKKREEYILNKIDEKSLLFSTRMFKILTEFIKDDSHLFFSKVRELNNEKDYLERLNNTAIDLFICMMPQNFYDKQGIIPILYTQDEGLKKMYESIKPDLIVIRKERQEQIVTYIYKEEMLRLRNEEYAQNFFTEEKRKRRMRVSKNLSITHSSQVKKELKTLLELENKRLSSRKKSNIMC